MERNDHDLMKTIWSGQTVEATHESVVSDKNKETVPNLIC